MSARITTQQLAAEINDLKSMFAMFMAMQTGAPVKEVAPAEVKHVPTQEPAVPVAEKYVPDAPKAAVEVAPVKHGAKAVIPSVAAWQHDGVLWVAFPPMGNCADEASVLFDALRAEPWFVNFDKAGNASAKKSVRVLPYIADKGLAAKFTGHSASIGSFDRAPKLADVAKRVKEIFAARKIVPVEVKPATKAAPVAKPDSAPVFA